MNVSILPDECVHTILSSLHPSTLLAASATCRHWRRVVDETVWSSVCRRMGFDVSTASASLMRRRALTTEHHARFLLECVFKTNAVARVCQSGALGSKQTILTAVADEHLCERSAEIERSLMSSSAIVRHGIKSGHRARYARLERPVHSTHGRLLVVNRETSEAIADNAAEPFEVRPFIYQRRMLVAVEVLFEPQFGASFALISIRLRQTLPKLFFDVLAERRDDDASPVGEETSFVRAKHVADDTAIRVVNIVATSSSSSLPVDDLESVVLALKMFGAELKPNMMLLPHRNGVVVMVYASGQMVVAGATSLDDIVEARRYTLRSLREALGRDFDDEEDARLPLTLQNVVASGRVGHDIQLRRFADQHQEACTFNPLMFPGATYRIDADIVCNVFGSGRFILSGMKSVDDVERYDAHMRALLSEEHAL